jgi:DNA-damage-inducible protein J
MKNDNMVRARIDGYLKEEAANILAAMGLTISDAFRMMITRIVNEKALPFSPLVPNEKTIKAMRAARQGKLTTVGSIDALLKEIDENN